jgi:predicted AlkP superfamily pyrophosphatase or phosphodiesterase
MVSIDGLRADLFKEPDEYGLKVPTLRRLISEGACAGAVVGVLPTVTYPSHMTLITGVWPAEHGIFANGYFDPLQQSADNYAKYASDVRVPTLWDAAQAANITTASVAWPVTVAQRSIAYNLPEDERLDTPEAIRLQHALSRPDGLLYELETKLGPYVGAAETVEADAVRTRFAIEILRTKRPRFMTVHLLGLDGASHEHGPFSSEALKTLEILDSRLQELWQAALRNDPRSILVVVSDHGFTRTDYRVNWMIPFIAAGLLKVEADPGASSKVKIVDWDATLWPGGGGSAAVMLKRPEDNALKLRVRQLLESLRIDHQNGIARIIDGDRARQQGGWTNAAFVIELDPNYRLGFASTGPLITPASATGMHGYFPDRPEMRSVFCVAGKGIAKGRNLGVVDMRQIAPTVARLLGVSLPTATMRALDVEVKDYQWHQHRSRS